MHVFYGDVFDVLTIYAHPLTVIVS